MDVILIAATTVDGCIARHSNEVIDWTLDLHLFKEQTMGCPVIMGSNTKKTLKVDLSGREEVVVHRHDNPKKILNNIKTKKCFVIGGGRVNTMFSPYLTHIYLTFHPLVFTKGIKLFTGLKNEMKLIPINVVPVLNRKNLFQFQYKIQK
tara:strand:- start:1923 stop:2369 length:447 start_codon:yes stop_codon:yes gene_type:complete